MSRRVMHLNDPRLPTPTQVGQELWKTTGEMVLRGRALSKTLFDPARLDHAEIDAIGVHAGHVAGHPWCGGNRLFAGHPHESHALGDHQSDHPHRGPCADDHRSVLTAWDRGTRPAKGDHFGISYAIFRCSSAWSKGLQSPALAQLDLLRTYSASGLQSFLKLRLPASVPYLFTSLKIGIAAALVGTIVG